MSPHRHLAASLLALCLALAVASAASRATADPTSRATEPSPPPAPPPFQVGGEWSGWYLCGQGRTNLVLRVTAVRGNRIEAVFDFDFRPRRTQGAFYVTGTWDPRTRRVTFTPGAWVHRPAGWEPVGMTGTVRPDGSRYEGRITHAGCGAFHVTAPAVP